MKFINKILCFLSVFFLCVPLLCFSASASTPFNSDSFTPEYYCSSSDYGSYLSSNSFLKSKPYCSRYVPSNYYFFDLSNPTEAFKGSLAFLYSFAVDSPDTYSRLGFNLDSDIYYVFYYGTNVKNGSSDVNDAYFVLLSGSPFRLVSDSSSSYFESDTPIYTILGSNYDTSDVSDYTSDPKTLKNNTKGSVFYNDDYNTAYNPCISVNGYTSGSSSSFFSYNFNSLYSNVPDLNFPDNYIYSKVPGLATFKDEIDVKLTPEFTIGMDRSIPNSTFGISEDYWSLEVTNNNDVNIQFKCYIIPATGAVNYVSEWSHDESLKSYSSGIPVLVNTNDFIPVVPDETVWMLEKDQWIYSKETENQEDYYKDTPYLVNKPTSNFFVQAGGTFKQVIKWNQLNLNKSQPYQILVTACECPYDRASDIHISLASDNYSQTFKHIIEESYFIVYDDTFSVSNPLYYDSTESFGGVIANSGSSQVNNDYWKLNAIEKDGEIEIRNADYSNGWRLNPDGGADSGTLKEGLFNNLDDISISDVTKLVQDSSNYFSVLATVFKVFPVWIWVLLFSGISGLVVMGIFKMLH